MRALCAGFPGEYWRRLDRERGYPSEFVAALTKAGFLAALIPEQYGGSGLPLAAAAAIMEEIHASGGNGAACHAQMYTMGTLLRHGSEAQKQRWLPAIAERRTAAAGVRRQRADLGLRYARACARPRCARATTTSSTARKSGPRAPSIPICMLLLARTTPREQGEEAQPTACRCFWSTCGSRRAAGISINPIRTMMNHATTEIFFDDLRVPAENLIGEEGEGFRYILSGMNAERILIAAECIGDAKWFIAKATAYAKEREVFDRPIGQNQGVQFPIARAYAQMRAAELMVREAASLYQAGRDCGAEANWRSCSPPMRPGRRPRCACRPTAASALPRSSTSSASSARRGLYQVAPISTNLILSYLAEHVLGLPRSY